MSMEKIAVIGAGTMGSGIAQAFAEHGFSVIFYARRPEGVQEGCDRIKTCLEGQVRKGRISEDQRRQTMNRLLATSDLSRVEEAEFVVESIAEELAVKREMMRKLESICAPDTIFTTNTSSISISAIAAALKRPERMCGLHFFYPPPKMPVIEIAVARQTVPQTLEKVKSVITRLGKTGIQVQESPGFVFNRLIIPMINEAAYLLLEGAANKEDIDAMLCLAASHPVGPLALADIIGLDICLDIMEVLQHELGEDKYRPCPLLRRMVYAGELGRKSGRGFYEYSNREQSQ